MQNNSKRNLKSIVRKSKKAITKSFVKTYSALHQRIGVIFWVSIFILFVSVMFSLRYLEAFIENSIESYGYSAIVLVSFITDLLAQPVGPDVPLAIALLIDLFNPWFILIAILIGSYCAFIGSYYIGKSVGAAGMQKLLGEKRYAKVMKRPNYGKWFLFLGTLTPIPYIPYIAGMLNLNVRQCIFLVIIPRTIRFTVVLLLLMYVGPVILDWFFL